MGRELCSQRRCLADGGSNCGVAERRDARRELPPFHFSESASDMGMLRIDLARPVKTASAPLILAPMRRLAHDHHGTHACHDTAAGPTLRTRGRGMALPAPLAAPAGTEGPMGLWPRLPPHLAAAVYGAAGAVRAWAPQARSQRRGRRSAPCPPTT